MVWAGNADDRKSTSGYRIYLVNNMNNLLSWSFKKQKVIALSSTESEYRALSLVVDTELTWFKSLFSEVNMVKFEKAKCCVIAKSKRHSCYLREKKNCTHEFHNRTKHIELDVLYVRQQVAAQMLPVQ